MKPLSFFMVRPLILHSGETCLTVMVHQPDTILVLHSVCEPVWFEACQFVLHILNYDWLMKWQCWNTVSYHIFCFRTAWGALILINMWIPWECVACTIWRHWREVVMTTFPTNAVNLVFHIYADLFDVYLPSHILPVRCIHVLVGQKWFLHVVLVLLIFFVLLVNQENFLEAQTFVTTFQVV